MSCTFLTQDKGDLVVIEVVGDFDFGGCSLFCEEANPERYSDDAHLIIDMTRCEYLDASGLGVMLHAVRNFGGQVSLVVNELVSNVLLLTRLDSFFDTFEDLPSALAAIEPS